MRKKKEKKKNTSHRAVYVSGGFYSKLDKIAGIDFFKWP